MIEIFQAAVEHAQRVGLEQDVDVRLRLIGGGIEVEGTHWSYKDVLQVPYAKIGQNRRALILAIDSIVNHVKQESATWEPGRKGCEP